MIGVNAGRSIEVSREWWSIVAAYSDSVVTARPIFVFVYIAVELQHGSVLLSRCQHLAGVEIDETGGVTMTKC